MSQSKNARVIRAAKRAADPEVQDRAKNWAHKRLVEQELKRAADGERRRQAVFAAEQMLKASKS